MKKKWIAVLIVFIILGLGISGFLIWTDNGDEVDSFNMDAHPGLEWERVNNRGYNKFDFLYFPAEVEGTQETVGKISQLIEDGETYVVSHPEEIVVIKLDNDEEIYAFLDEMQEDLKYTDSAIGQNMFYKMLLSMNVRIPQPEFLFYIPEGNLSYEYYITDVSKKGKEELYITIQKAKLSNDEDTMDGCLIGLIPQTSDEAATIKGVSTIHVELVEY